MQIQILSVTCSTVPTAKGSYEVAEVAYKKDGKVEGKKIMSFANKKVFDIVKKAQSGESYEVTTTKDEKGYWQWSDIAPAGSAPAQSSAPAFTQQSVKSSGNWETPEERAKRQVYIIRQSSIGHAVDTLKTDKKAPTEDEVLSLAETYVQYVLNGPKKSVEEQLNDLEDDIPY